MPPLRTHTAPTPEPGPFDPGTHASLLPRLRALAAHLDPANAAAYAGMSLDRWQAGADVAARLLLEQHIALLYRRAGRGDRRTRRAVAVLVNTASDVDLLAGLCVLVWASDLLDDARKG